jgi:hypothetical protein
MEFLIVIVALVGIIGALVGLFFLGLSQGDSAILLLSSLLLVLIRALWDLPTGLVWLWLLATIVLATGFYVRTRRS